MRLRDDGMPWWASKRGGVGGTSIVYSCCYLRGPYLLSWLPGSRNDSPTNMSFVAVAVHGPARAGRSADRHCHDFNLATQGSLSNRRPQKSFVLQHPTTCSLFCLIFQPRDSETAISVFKALESRQKLGFQRRRSTLGGGPARAAPKPTGANSESPSPIGRRATSVR